MMMWEIKPICFFVHGTIQNSSLTSWRNILPKGCLIVVINILSLNREAFKENA